MALFAPPHPTIFCHVREKKAPWSLWVTLGEPAGCPHRAAPHYRRYEKSSGAEPSLKKHTGALPTPLSVPPPPDASPPPPFPSSSGEEEAVLSRICCGSRSPPCSVPAAPPDAFRGDGWTDGQAARGAPLS